MWPVLLKPRDIYPLLDWETTTAKSSTTTAEESEYSQYEDFGVLPTDWLVPGPPTDNFCWNNITSSANAAAASGDDLKYFQEIFQDLSNIEPDPSLQMQQPAPNIFSSGKEFLSGLSLEKGEYTGKTTTSHEMETKSVALSEEFKQNKDERPKRSHAAELHNMSEKKRRNRIRGKLEVIQELIPNCNKTDQSSMLDDAIKYIKSLQLQVQMMSMGGGSVYHTPNLSLAGIPSTQMPQLMPYLPMGPGLGTSNAYEIGMGLGMRMGMGMANMCYTTGIPTMSVPSASAGLPLMSGPGVLPANIPQLQMQLPFLASQGMPGPAFTTSNMVEPQFATDFCHALRRV